MTEDELREIEGKLAFNDKQHSYRNEIPLDEECRALIAEVRRLRALRIPGFNLTVEQIDNPPDLSALHVVGRGS